MPDNNLHILQTEWEKEHIKNPPPLNVTDDQRKLAREKIIEMNKIKSCKINLS